MPLKNFTLLAKLEELDLQGHSIVKKFEKSERHVLSAEIRHTNATLLHLVIRAAKTQLEERRLRLPLVRTRELLWQADVELEYLKIQVRKAFSLKLINEKVYEQWTRSILACGGLLGGWLKKVNESALQAPAPAPRATQGKLM